MPVFAYCTSVFRLYLRLGNSTNWCCNFGKVLLISLIAVNVYNTTVTPVHNVAWWHCWHCWRTTPKDEPGGSFICGSHSWGVLYRVFMVKNGRVKDGIRGWLSCAQFQWSVIYKGKTAFRCAYARFYKSEYFLQYAIFGFWAHVHFSTDPMHSFKIGTPGLRSTPENPAYLFLISNRPEFSLSCGKFLLTI